jgi:hypothetical protein
MVFQNNFVAVVVCNGRILREHDGAVTLPFGSDYSLKLKNLESRKALVSVSIDGQDVLNGKQLIVAPDSDALLDGFMDGSEVHSRFRFIRKTQEVIEHRGDGLDDGIIRIEYRFEEHKPVYVPVYHEHHHHNYHHYYHRPFWSNVTYRSTSGGSESQTGDTAVKSLSSADVSINTAFTPTPAEDEGITVRGGDTHQHFSQGYIGTTESQSHVITIRLRGTTDSGVVVEKPVTTRDKLECPSCGKRWKSSQKFCGGCGTRLG